MPEKFIDESPERNQFNENEYYDLLSRARQNIETLSPQERARLVRFGYYWLDIKENDYEATYTFELVQDFEGLRKVADKLIRERSDSFYLIHALTLLEDHNGIHDLLNRKDVELGRFPYYGQAFDSLDQPLREYIRKFLEENKIPAATGVVNEGVDLIAIRNLAQDYDIAVPIAHGGLKQGAIANLWGMPVRIADIAAHNRKVARGKWINPVSAEDFNGKRVLLFDKDAVSGASIRKAVSMLSLFQTESIGVYFTHPVLESGTNGIGTLTHGLPEGLEIFSPRNVSMEKAGDAYLEAHERLGTLYGRRRKIDNLFIQEAQKLQEKFPELAKAFRIFATEQARVFDSLNPNLAGISEVREKIILKMHQLYLVHQENLRGKLYDFPDVVENMRQILLTTPSLPLEFELELIRARYSKPAKEAARRRNIENPHEPSDPLAAFNAAQKAVKEGIDIVLIVGPEGFAYEPYFQDLGVPTVAVNIPESGKNESRTIKLLDDLTVLQGKKVLVVEDDVRTGLTLQKIIENLQPYNPVGLGLYLGQPKRFQRVANIPQSFEKTYLAEDSATAGREFIEHLESKGLKVFKTNKI